ncbi:MAG TPA: site-specific integrase [bacterium]|jgi:integrase
MASVYARKLSKGWFWYGCVSLKDGPPKKYNTGIETEPRYLKGGDGREFASPAKWPNYKKAMEAVKVAQKIVDSGKDPFRQEELNAESVEGLAKGYLDTRRSEGTDARVLYLHQSTVQFFLVNYAHRAAKSVTAADLLKFRTWLMDRGKVRRGVRIGDLSQVTINGHMTRLGAFLNFCGTIIGWKPPTIKRLKAKRTKPIRYYSGEECGRLLASAAKVTYNGEPLSWFLAFVLYTGMRKGEALSCEWSWVDYAANHILIPAMKSAQSRAVPIAEPLREILDRMPRTRARLFDNISNLHRGSGHLDDLYKKVQAEAKLEPLTLHDLRRTFIIQCLAAGIPLELVMQWVGHESDKTTLEYYTSFAKENHAALIGRVRFTVLPAG